MSEVVGPRPVCVGWRLWSEQYTPQTAEGEHTAKRWRIRLASRGILKSGTTGTPTEFRHLPHPYPSWFIWNKRNNALKNTQKTWNTFTAILYIQVHYRCLLLGMKLVSAFFIYLNKNISPYKGASKYIIILYCWNPIHAYHAYCLLSTGLIKFGD